MRFLKIAILAVLFIFISCEEKLPDRIESEVCLKVTTALATQGTDAAGQLIEFLIIAENNYHETLQDSVRISGSIHVWWKRKPWLEATLNLSNIDIMSPPTNLYGQVLTIDPGQVIALRNVWYLYTDDNKYIPDLLDYSHGEVTGEIMYASTEEFVFDAVITIFNKTGLLYVEPVSFLYKGWRHID